MPLRDKVAVIIGATGQLGPSVARAFAGAGARLVLVGTREEELNTLIQELGLRESRGADRPRFATHVANVMDEASTKELVDWVMLRFQGADILLHLVGGYQAGPLRETANETWDYMFNVNVRTAFNAIRAFLPLLMANGWGRIVTISSAITQSPPATSAAYVAAKAALEALTISVAQDVRERGVTANVVLTRALDTPSERAKQPTRTTGWVRPEEVAATLLFLCSEEAGAINGARIPVLGAK